MKYTLVNNFDAFEKRSNEWNSLLSESIADLPFLRHEYLRSWWASLGGGEWDAGELAIIIAERDGELIGIAPLFQNEKSLFFLGSVEISDYLDFIVREAD